MGWAHWGLFLSCLLCAASAAYLCHCSARDAKRIRDLGHDLANAQQKVILLRSQVQRLKEEAEAKGATTQSGSHSPQTCICYLTRKVAEPLGPKVDA